MNDFKEFSVRYKEHLDWLDIEYCPNSQLNQIFKVFSAIHRNGGWARTVGLNNWDSVTGMPDGRIYYEKNFLVSFERILKNSWPYSADVTKNIDFSLLKTVGIYYEVRHDQWEELLAEDLVVFRNVYSFGISENLTSLKNLKDKHGNEEISVIVQESDTSGFSVKKATKQKMKLKKYIEIMEQNFRDDRFIRFAVNVDIGNWKEEIDELRKYLPSEVLWCSKDDSLQYLRQHILGMTLPQLYLKINGCWTGGHEENLRFSAANINHGPSACEWWGLDSSQSLQLREKIKQDKNFEIYNSETLWWPDEIYCLIQGFSVYHIIQQPGDLITVGAGTIHWVKSCGVTTNTAWNFGPKYLNNFIKSFERDCINRAIHYKSLVPMHLLSLDLLNNEINTLDIGLVEYLKDAILAKDKEEFELWNDSVYKSIELNNSDNVIHCEICYLEIFRVYYKCKKCVKNRFAGGNKVCFFCFFCIEIHCVECKGGIVATQKFIRKDLMKLVKNIDRRCKGDVLVMGVESLKYPFDKNIEENIYISPFNGISSNPKTLLPPPIYPAHSNTLIKPKQKLSKIPKEQSSAEPSLKLSSLTAKKKMNELPEQSNIDQLLQNYAIQDQHKDIFRITKRTEDEQNGDLIPIKQDKLNKNKEIVSKTEEHISKNGEKLRKNKSKVGKKEEKLGKNEEIMSKKVESVVKNKANTGKMIEKILKKNQNLSKSEENKDKRQEKAEKREKNSMKGEAISKRIDSKLNLKLNAKKRSISNEILKDSQKNLIVNPEVAKKIEDHIIQCVLAADEQISIPVKRFRSTDVYMPVLGIIPAKVSKAALA